MTPLAHDARMSSKRGNAIVFAPLLLGMALLLAVLVLAR